MNLLKIDNGQFMIRNLKPEDVDAFLAYRRDPEVTRYQGFEPFDLYQAKAFIEEQKNKGFGIANEWIQYGIEDKTAGHIIGDCAIKLDAICRSAEIGITVSPVWQRKGIAKETISAVLNFLFRIDNFHRVSAVVDTRNISSVKLMESVGFRREACLLENIFFKGEWSSEYVYAILKDEWEYRLTAKMTT